MDDNQMFNRASVRIWRVSLAVLFLLLLSSCRRATDYLERGNKFFTASRYEDAILNYRKAIQKDRKFGEAYYRLGVAELQRGNRPIAFSALATARALLPNRDDVVVKYADLELEMLLADSSRPAQLYDDLVTVSDKLLARYPDSYDGLRFKGHLALLDGKTDAAVNFFSRANSIKPMQPDVIMLWSQILLQDARAPEGEQLALSLIRTQKTYGPIYDVLVRYYLSRKRAGDAENILKTKVDNNPRQIDFALQLASWYSASGKKDAMSAIFLRLTNDPKTFPDARLWIGDFYTAQQDWPHALQEYQEGAKTSSKNRITFLKRIVDTLLAEGKGEEAAGVVVEILKERPKDEAARAVDASLLVASGKPDNVDAAVKELRELVTQSPANPVWRFNLGLALVAKGDADAAAAQLEEAIKNRRDFLPPRLILSQVYYLKRNFENALRYADEILAVRPENFDARLMRVGALTNLRRYRESHLELADLEKRFPENADVQFQIVALDAADKEFADAERRLQRLYAKPATQTRALQEIVMLYGAEEHLDKAFILLTNESKKSPRSDTVLSLLASTALRLGRYDQALSSYQELLQKNPKSSELYRLIGAAYEGKGDRAKAIGNFEEAVNLAPNDPAAIAGLADLLRLAGRAPDAMARYRRLLQMEPGNATAMNNLAYLLVDTGGNLDEAERLVQRALQLIPNEPSFTDTLGVIYTKKKQNESSMHLFESLVRKYPEEPAFRYHYGLALMEAGYKEKARVALETALRKNPSEDVRQSIGLALGRVGR